MASESGLLAFIDASVSVITNDGKIIVGVLRGFDQATNLILDDCHERVFSSTSGVEKIGLGLFVVRGDNIAVLGELDDELEAQIDFDVLRGEPLRPVTH